VRYDLDKQPAVRFKADMPGITVSLPTLRLPRCVMLAGALLLPWLVPASADSLCPAVPALPALTLPHLSAALKRGAEGVIVALGSSSTRGNMASDSAHSYPAVLQAALSRVLPHAHIAVLNRGIGGQDAPEELARLQTDVIAVRPQLVIWQVGANGALHNIDPVAFRRMVATGVNELHQAGIDVVLMDNQHSPRIDAAPEHRVLDDVLAQVATTTGASLFPRSRLMREWGDEGAPPIEFVSTDGLHHNDRGYTCVARSVAQEIASAVTEAPALSASLAPQRVSNQEPFGR
jgi:acyl-CoA thioesterase-1